MPLSAGHEAIITFDAEEIHIPPSRSSNIPPKPLTGNKTSTPSSSSSEEESDDDKEDI